MRTTLTLEDDVAVALERLRERDGLTLKAAVNEALRRGLRAMEAPEEYRRGDPYRIRPWDGGRPLAENVDDVAETLAFAEGEDFR